MSTLDLVISFVVAFLFGCVFFGLALGPFHAGLMPSLALGVVGFFVGYALLWNE